MAQGGSCQAQLLPFRIVVAQNTFANGKSKFQPLQQHRCFGLLEQAIGLGGTNELTWPLWGSPKEAPSRPSHANAKESTAALIKPDTAPTNWRRSWDSGDTTHVLGGVEGLAA